MSISTAVEKPSLAIYVVTHKPECTWLNDSCIPLEIGAACRTNHCCELRDNIGEDNISAKDKLYCELTGLYWIYKNDTHDYVGMYHYRRVFKLSSEKIMKYLEKYDIIVPKKIPILPNLDLEYAKSKIPIDWEICKEVLRDLTPEYYATLNAILSENRQHAYNMFVTNRRLFKEYCEWLFPILFEIEKRFNQHAEERLTYHEKKMSANDMGYLKGSYERSIGYLAERLLHLFIIHHSLNVKEMNIYYPKPYNPISSKCPKIIANIAGKNQFLIRSIIYAQDRFGWSLLRFLKKK